jgi:hypothetical protein
MFLVVACWAAAVSGPVERLVRSSDQLGCIGPHLTQFFVLTIAGMAGGLSLSPLVERGSDYAARAIMPSLSERRRGQVLKAGALLLIVGGMVMVFPWLNSHVDQFIAVHNALRAEIDLVVLVMGMLSGAAWTVIWRRYAWAGAVLTIVMMLMMLTNTLSRHAWC